MTAADELGFEGKTVVGELFVSSTFSDLDFLKKWNFQLSFHMRRNQLTSWCWSDC